WAPAVRLRPSTQPAPTPVHYAAHVHIAFYAPDTRRPAAEYSSPPPLIKGIRGQVPAAARRALCRRTVALAVHAIVIMPGMADYRHSLIVVACATLCATQGCVPLAMTAAGVGMATGVSHTLGGIGYKSFAAP